MTRVPEADRMLDLTEEERGHLVELLLDTVSNDRFPLSPRIKTLRRVLAKLGVGHSPAMPHPPLAEAKPWQNSSQSRKPRRR